MNSEEQTLIDGLFSRVQQAETDSAPRDAQAEARIKEHLARQPAAAYYMTQSILVQEHALKSLDEQNRQLQAELTQARAELQQARNQAPAPASSSGGFLSSIFGGGRDPQPAPSSPQQASASTGGWREPARANFASAPPQNFNQQPNAQQPGYAPQQQAPAAGGGFMAGALKTAAGVAGGVMLAQGISSLFNSHSQQPEVIEEIVKEEPAPASDSGAAGQDEQRVANNDDWGNNAQDGFADAGYDDYGSDFSDDDSFV